MDDCRSRTSKVHTMSLGIPFYPIPDQMYVFYDGPNGRGQSKVNNIAFWIEVRHPVELVLVCCRKVIRGFASGMLVPITKFEVGRHQRSTPFGSLVMNKSATPCVTGSPGFLGNKFGNKSTIIDVRSRSLHTRVQS
jgi:hypothetical protein